MPDDVDNPRRNWVREPLGANHVRLHVEVPEGVELSDEAHAAIDVLMRELYTAEIVNIPHCPSLKACGSYVCNPLGKCVLEKYPCLADVFCVIANVT